MKYVEIIADAGSSDTVSAIAEKAKALDLSLGFVGEDGMRQMRMLVKYDNVQLAHDTLRCQSPLRKTTRRETLQRPRESCFTKKLRKALDWTRIFLC